MNRGAMAWGAVAVALLPMALVGALLFPATRGHHKGMSCQNQEKQLGLIFRIYAKDHGGAWPALSPEPGLLLPDWLEIVPQYLSDRHILVCPKDSLVDREKVLSGQDRGSYYYLGYVIRDQNEMNAFAAAYRARLAEGGGFDEDLPLPQEFGGGMIQRVTDERAKELAPPGESSNIPVLFERASNHVPGGMNVLFLDGHVEFVKLGKAFPAMQETMDVIQEMEAEVVVGDVR